MTRKEMNKDTTEYEKDLSELKEQILKEGNTLLTKRDLLERFCEIDKEYKGGPWNLLQILANINILIGEKPQTGHWILLDECSNGGYYCSECHKKVVKEGWSNTVKKIKFCPNCGKRMIEPQGSEDKE
jgi:DNA-directed RNA polymerase subunit RPC12/RpoP